MSKALLDAERFLKRVDTMQRQLEFLKRELVRGIHPGRRKVKVSLYGSVKGGDVTEEMIEEAKRSLFRELKDI
jgi:hypothetical protein